MWAKNLEVGECLLIARLTAVSLTAVIALTRASAELPASIVRWRWRWRRSRRKRRVATVKACRLVSSRSCVGWVSFSCRVASVRRTCRRCGALATPLARGTRSRCTWLLSRLLKKIFIRDWYDCNSVHRLTILFQLAIYSSNKYRCFC